MDRRAFIGTLGGSLLAAPLAAEAQQAKVYRLEVLLTGSPPPPGTSGILRPALRDLGYIVGQNLTIDARGAEGKSERLPSLAAELVALKPDAIIADSTPAAIAVARATATIPIVMVNVSDPVGVGLVASLAHPGGNVTGGTDFGLDVAAKYVELIHAAIPKATRLAVLMSDNPVHPSQLKAIQDAARGIGLTVLPTLARSADEFEASFASMMRQHAGAMILLGGPPFSTRSQIEKLVALAAKTKLPGMYETRGIVEAGGLLSYGPSTVFKWTRAAHYVARIFKGAAPGDLPVEQPTQLELAVNLKTAKALGLTIPPSLLQRADHVIE